jgi:hypothetical protein
MIEWRTVTLALVALALIVGAALDVGNPGACTDAKALARRGLLSDARTAYVDLLKDDHGCAAGGIDDVTVKQCAQALALKTAGRTQEAEKRYLSIATSEPVRPAAACALEGLGAAPRSGS